MNDIVEVILRSLAVYAFMIIAIRLAGKKELSQLNTSDLILILLISNSVQNAMVGSNSSLEGGLVAAASLFVMNYLLKLFLFKNEKFKEILEGEPTLLIYKGEVIIANLAKEKISLTELQEALREHGIAEFKDVALSFLERDGNISVVPGSIGIQHLSRRKSGSHPKLRGKK